jgi:tRNA G18 (ribose-2'-O)-methylase SpoU
MLDNLTDNRNVGSIFRLADALGVERIYLIGKTPFPPDKIITKVSRYTENETAWEYYDSEDAAVKKATEDGYTIVAAEITDKSKELLDYDFRKLNKICIAVGSENEGVCEKILGKSEDAITIKMMGKNSSMNAAMALAIITYQIIAQIK